MPGEVSRNHFSLCDTLQCGLAVIQLLLLAYIVYNYLNKNMSVVSDASSSSVTAPAGAVSKFVVHPPEYYRKLMMENFRSRNPMKARKNINENYLAGESFTNSSPNDSASDYSSYYQPADSENANTQPYDPADEGLDRSVYDSHNAFIDESDLSSQSPSAAYVERDDTNEVVKRWGLRRVDYTSTFSEDDARTVSSEYPEQVAQKVNSYTI